MARTLILYYSFEGCTKHVAELMANHLNADVQQVKPEKEIKSKGFGKFIWGGSQVVMGKTPKLLPMDKKIEDYDLIVIGSPVWAGSYTPPIKTLLEGDMIKNKKVAFYCCYDGSPGKTEEKVKQAMEPANTVVGFKGFLNPKNQFDVLKEDIINWADSLKRLS